MYANSVPAKFEPMVITLETQEEINLFCSLLQAVTHDLTATFNVNYDLMCEAYGELYQRKDDTLPLKVELA